MPVERLLDPSWVRVKEFDPKRPSAANQSDDAMEVDGGREEEGSGSEWEYEETEEMVTLDLGPESKRLFQMSHQYSITGLESANPFFRLGNVLFKGQWDQLLGTEIILRDDKDSSKSSLSQHDFQPLPATETDIRTGRAPSTTRNRIQFRPAANLAAREQALRDPLDPSKVVHVSHKGGWIWKRGKGWIKKDQLNLIDDTGEEGNDDAAVVGERSQTELPGENAARPGAQSKKVGRKKMTDEEKLKQSIWTSLKKIDKMKGRGGKKAQTADEEGSQVGSQVEEEGNVDEDDGGALPEEEEDDDDED
jgi:hypothetical protein